MGYDLIAKNEEAGDITVGMFSWPYYLQQSGAGYVLGYGPGVNIDQYTYVPCKNTGGSPVSNDGFAVDDFSAKAMAAVLRGWASVHEFANDKVAQMSPLEKSNHEYRAAEFPKQITGLVAKELIEKIKVLADWMEKSGGFEIH